MRRRFISRRTLAILFVTLSVYLFGKFIFMPGRSTYKSLPLRYLDMNMESIHKQITPLPVKKRVPTKRVHSVSCSAILNGDKREIKRARGLMESKEFKRKQINDTEYIQMTRNCDKFKHTREYSNYVPSPEENDFPIAYSILLYKDVEQAERLLRAIYTPNNVYCIHVDADSPKHVHDAVQGIANCFDNVFVPSRKEYIVYAGFTRLQADLNCMENALQQNRQWKYFINLPSQQFPLKTNSEIVTILKIYNGANDIEGIVGNRRLEIRFKYHFLYRHVKGSKKPKIIKTSLEKDDPPYNISVVKGSAYGVFSRDFVKFVTFDKKARAILDWFRDVKSPDEYFWSTLNHNPQIGTPGAYKGRPDDKPWLAVYAAWGGADPCAGKFVRGVCVFGVGDLKLLSEKKELFANKFYIDYQPLAMDCLEEWHLNRTTFVSRDTLNTSFYTSLKFINRNSPVVIK